MIFYAPPPSGPFISPLVDPNNRSDAFTRGSLKSKKFYANKAFKRATGRHVRMYFQWTH